MSAGQHGEESIADHAELLNAFAGVFALAEPPHLVRERVDAAIEASLVGLPWTLRAVARPLLRRAAHIPEWVRFQPDGQELTIAFAGRGLIKEIALRSRLDGPATRQRLVPAIAGNVIHTRSGERTLRSEILVELGTITNVYELIDRSRLAGDVTIRSEQLGAPIHYGMELVRTQE